VALQLNVDGVDKPVLITQDRLARTLQEKGIDPIARLRLDAGQVAALQGDSRHAELSHIDELGRWLVSISLPLENPIQGRAAQLTGTFDLSRTLARVAEHPFNRTGHIQIIDKRAQPLLGQAQASDKALLDKVYFLLTAGNNSAGAVTYNAADGSAHLGGYAFTTHLPWAVLASRDAETAYLAVQRMLTTLLMWMAFGLLIAVVGALIFARRISQPVVAITNVAHQVGAGDLDAEVPPLNRGDEIGTLGERINEMIAGLRERERVKDIFGRYQTPEVMRTLLSSPEALGLGGESRRITVMMTDLRGFTALSERLAPHEVVRLLNHYFEYMVEICQRHNGTINEIIGDGLLVFFGAPMRSDSHERQAIACALEMQLAMEQVNRESAAMGLPALEMGIGLNSGEVVVGNIGSSKRAKYAAVGSDVNLTARIESYTVGGEILVSNAVLSRAGEGVEVVESRQVSPKGVKEPMTIYSIGALRGADQTLVLARQEEAFRELATPLEVLFTALEGKHMGEAKQSARIIALSAQSALLTDCVEPPERLTNLMLNLTHATWQGRDIYAKVMGEREGRVEVRFTSLPEGLAPWLLAAP